MIAFAWQSHTVWRVAGFAAISLAIFWLCLKPAYAEPAAPFKDFAGWWQGEGRIGIRDGKTERIRCRVTYFLSNEGHKLKQNLRCTTESYKIEVKADLDHNEGKVTGSWKETVYNVGGGVSGKIDENKLTLFVRGQDLNAMMQVLTKAKRQIVEIKFEGLDVLGVSILLAKGQSASGKMDTGFPVRRTSK